MINSIQPAINAATELPSTSNTKEVFETLTFAVNFERGLVQDISKQNEILKRDRDLMANEKGYASLKKYIHSKLDLLKNYNLNMATRAFSNAKTALMLKVAIAPGFSDYVYYFKPKGKGFCEMINSESDVYIITPVGNPLGQKGALFDTSSMYKVPGELL